MPPPSFSVVVPLYNKRDTVERALRSVLAQTFQDFEIIVVDDGSTDGSAEEVLKISDSRIRLVRQSNAGVSAARNRGIAEGRAEWIAFLDADDEWLTDFLSTISKLQVRFPDCRVLATLYLFQDSGGARRLAVLKTKCDQPDQVLPDYFEVAGISDPPICSSAVVVRQSLLVAIGGFPVGIRVGEDLLTWAKLALHGPLALSRKPQAIFHQDAVRSDGTPSRVPDPTDRVGRELEALLLEATPGQEASLRKYIGRWHKMRASVYLRLGFRLRALRESVAALRRLPFEPRLYFYVIGCLIPADWVRRGLVLWQRRRANG
jgi:hypothetical protein